MSGSILSISYEYQTKTSKLMNTEFRTEFAVSGRMQSGEIFAVRTKKRGQDKNPAPV